MPTALGDARGGRSRSWTHAVWASLVFVVVAAVLLHESLFGGQVLVASDILYSHEPWNAVAPDGYEAPSNPFLVDQPLLFYPYLRFAEERISAGHLPLWNPLNYLGQPILAANSGSFLWPASFAYYAFPTLRFFAWHAFAKLVLAGMFTWLFLRRIGVSATAAISGAVAFELSGFLVAWLGHPATNVALLLPLLLWQVEGVAQGPSRRRRFVGVALSVALALCAGHFQTASHVFTAVGLWALFRTRVSISGRVLAGRGLLGLALSFVLGLALAAPQVLPFLDYLSVSQVETRFAEMDMVGDVPMPEAALLMVNPGLWGLPHHGDYHGPSGNNVNYPDLAGGFVGRLALLLALLGLVRLRSRSSIFFWVLAVVAALVAWKVWPLYELAREVPILRATKYPRLLLLVAFSLSVLAAQGLDALLARRAARTRFLLSTASFVVIAAELLHFGYGFNTVVSPDDVFPRTPVTDYLEARSGLFRVMGTEVTTLMANANIPYGLATLNGYDWMERTTTTELGLRLASRPPRFPVLSEVQAFYRQDTQPLASLLNIRFVLSPIPLPEPLVLQPVEGAYLYENPSVLPRAFFARDVVVIQDAGQRLDHLASPDFNAYQAVLEKRPHSAFHGAWMDASGAPGSAHVEIVEYAPERIVMKTEVLRPELLVVSDSWDRDWSVLVDGVERSCLRVDHALRGVWLDAGDQLVEMRYGPQAFRRGLILCCIGLITCALLLLPRSSRRV